ncbi:DEAD/DEAH box helicase [Vibrio panuliri]|uniref:DEAD/DEAH box helicase n=1 Tax=Vibrio panuliri TaxID=1381081 RepID=A0ABX3F7A3_9VIBR|nr:DEAD/DEAH box helicase [Vibrio panuliri]KAB1457726.1 DEAD/DEAH box helicase [Vibrio panuliri]OLQ85791.1 DEAD/DEAH box helicase [Vibrio panuliri]
MSFSTLGLHAEIIASLPDGINNPTDIQTQTISKLLARHDLLALANTGSGKTLAYGLPLIQHQLNASDESLCLVLVPTRELANQVAATINEIASQLQLTTVCLTGGADKVEQLQALTANPHILVATTGRMLDLLADAAFDAKRIKQLVLDEADRLLDMGFWQDVQAIAGQISAKRQTAMFSATFSAELKQKAAQLMFQPLEVAVHQPNSTNQAITEMLYLVNKGSKTKALIHLLEHNQWRQAIVFIGAKENADNLSKKLSKAGVQTTCLHGNKTQPEREQALAEFKSGEARVLIATDLLARGIHIDELPVVINFELPTYAEVYVHRVGRTARAGKQGVAVSLVCHGETAALNAIRELTQRALPLIEMAEFPVTDTPSSGESKRAPRDKQANRRTNNKKSIKQFQSKRRTPRS